MWKKKALKEKEDNDNSVFVRKDIKLKQEQFSNWIEDNLNPVDKLLDELDFSF